MFVFFIIGVIVGAECRLTDVIQTTKGPVQGEILKTVISSKEYSSFKGIPYAEPPLGYLRFKPPVEKKPWSDVLSATIEGANCVQKDFVLQNVITGSEDCLFLNVYSPQVDFQNINEHLKPVMIWIYGGTFKSGYGNSSLYGPDFLLEEDVILVTFNYRLGPLGFLSLNHDNATGNTGLKDQNLVLRWVNENIRSFGGDPDKVTIFGQSAGGVAVDFHVLSEMSQGLFHQAISMSASPLCPWSFYTPQNAEKQAFALGTNLGISSTSKEQLLEALYGIPAVDLVTTAEKMGSSSPPFKPTLEKSDVALNEDKFLTECSYEKYKSGNFTKVPYLTGFTNDETLLFTHDIESVLDLLISAMSYVKTIPSSISSIPTAFLEEIFSNLADKTTALSNDLLMQLVDVTSNLLFVHGIDTKQKLLQKMSDKAIYYYQLGYETEQSIHKLLYNINLKGVAHGDDIGYIFHMAVLDLSLDPNDPTFITRKRMTRLWANFAKYGNPTPDGEEDDLLQGIKWPESGNSGFHLRIDKNLSVGNRPVNKLIEFYQLANSITLPLQTGCSITDPIKSTYNSLLGNIKSFFRHVV